jgi:peptidoglycan/xylan/chitin deacetylase (PgdA/CDA1 family)/SAM-dependent methyltransferase
MFSKIVIIKADDFGLGGDFNFRKLINICNDLEVPLSIGVVGRNVDCMHRHEVNYFRSSFENPNIEIWNHSFSHRDFLTLSYQQQFDDISMNQKLLLNKFGVNCSIYGAPYNRYNQDSVDVLNNLPAIEAVYLLDDSLASNLNFFNINRSSLISPEFVRDVSRQVDCNEFIRRVNLKKNLNALTVQFHPPAWNLRGFKEFTKSVEFLMRAGYRFLNLNQFKNLIIGTQLANKSADLLAIESDEKSVFINQELKSKLKDSKLSDFFFNRHIVGTQHVLRSFKRIGFDKVSQSSFRSSSHSVLDFGCGPGSFSLGYSLLHPDAQIYSVDKLDSCVEIVNANTLGLNIKNIVAAKGDLTNFEINVKFDRAFCINAVQYMDLESYFNKMSTICNHKSDLLLVYQTYEYFIKQIYENVTTGNIDYIRIQSLLLPILTTYAKSFGVTIKNYGVYCYDEKMISGISKLSGFDTLISDILFEYPRDDFNSKPTQLSYLFELNLNAASKFNSEEYFISLSEVDRVEYLNKLFELCMHTRFSTLVDKHSDLIPFDRRHDFFIKKSVILGEIQTQNFSDLYFASDEYMKKFLALNFRSYDDFLVSWGDNEKSNILNLLFFTLTEKYNQVVDYYLTFSYLDLGVLSLVIYSAAHLKRDDIITSALDSLINIRSEVS